MSDKLTVVEQKEVTFYEDELTAVRADDGRVYVSIRHMCQALGIDDQGQRQRINRHTILGRGLMVCNLHTIQGDRDGYVLRVDLVPLWLSGIRTSAVNEVARPKLENFQEEAATVLWEAFQEGRLTTDLSFDDLLKSASADTLEAYQMAMALVKLARNQIMMDARINDNKAQLTEHTQRLEELESTLGDPGRYVTPDQASQISQAIKTVAIVLGKQTKRNEFGAVYGELYRKFGITSYKQLPANRFQACMDWLSEWHETLTGDSPF